MAEEIAVKKPKSKTKKIISWIVYGFFGALFAAVLIFQIIGLSTKKSNYGVPRFGKYQLNLVLTDSMEPEYPVGTLLIVKKVDASTLKVGDDVTFYYAPWSSTFDNPIVTHRIYTIKLTSPEKAEGEGQYTITTHGINTASKSSPDGAGDCTKQFQTFTEKQVLGKVVSKSKALGAFFNFISSIWGLLVLLVVPALYVIITSGIDIYKAVKEEEKAEEVAKKEESSSNISMLSDEDKKRLKEELIQEMMKEKQNEKK